MVMIVLRLVGNYHNEEKSMFSGGTNEVLGNGFANLG